MAKNAQNKAYSEQNINDCRNSRGENNAENNAQNNMKTENKAQNAKMQNKK